MAAQCVRPAKQALKRTMDVLLQDQDEQAMTPSKLR